MRVSYWEKQVKTAIINEIHTIQEDIELINEYIKIERYFKRLNLEEAKYYKMRIQELNYKLNKLNEILDKKHWNVL